MKNIHVYEETETDDPFAPEAFNYDKILIIKADYINSRAQPVMFLVGLVAEIKTAFRDKTLIFMEEGQSPNKVK